VEFGSLDDPEDFARIHGYSPYHNLRSGTCHPSTLVITGNQDDAAVPAHSDPAVGGGLYILKADTSLPMT